MNWYKCKNIIHTTVNLKTFTKKNIIIIILYKYVKHLAKNT